MSCRRLLLICLLGILSLQCTSLPKPPATSAVVPTNITGCNLSYTDCPTTPPPFPSVEDVQPYPAVEVMSGGKQVLTVKPGGAPPGLPNFQAPQNMYGGSFIPPVWVLTPGETIDLTVQTSMDLTQGYYTDNPSTNVHFHGFNVPPTYPTGDSVYVSIGANDSHQYTIDIPQDHPEGSYWFHPHPHGVSEPQVLGGMSGLILMKGLLSTYYQKLVAFRPEATICSPAAGQTCVAERFFILKDYVPKTGPSACCAVKSVNGQTAGKVTLTPNYPQYWHFANAGANQFFNISIRNQNGQLQPIYILAVDGNVTTCDTCVDGSGNPTARPLPAPGNMLSLPPGSRMDVLLQLSGKPGDVYMLYDEGTDTGTAGDANCPQQLGWIVLDGAPYTGDFDLAKVTSEVTIGNRRTPDVLKQQLPPCQVTTSGKQPQISLIVPFSEGAAQTSTCPWPNPGPASGATFSVLPNGVPYDPARVDTIVDATQPCVSEWTIDNTGTMEDHVFHIHQVDFVVETIGGIPKPFTGYQDTLRVPAGQNATILIPFTPDIAGHFVYHCHILNHEDQGMMANICVQSADAPCPATVPYATPHQAHGHRKVR